MIVLSTSHTSVLPTTNEVPTHPASAKHLFPAPYLAHGASLRDGRGHSQLDLLQPMGDPRSELGPGIRIHFEGPLCQLRAARQAGAIARSPLLLFATRAARIKWLLLGLASTDRRLLVHSPVRCSVACMSSAPLRCSGRPCTLQAHRHSYKRKY